MPGGDWFADVEGRTDPRPGLRWNPPGIVDDVAKTVAGMTARGATSLLPAAVTAWGDIRARLRDPFGYLWDLAQPEHTAGL